MTSRYCSRALCGENPNFSAVLSVEGQSTDQFDSVKLLDVGLEMEPLAQPAEIISHVLRIARLGAIQDQNRPCGHGNVGGEPLRAGSYFFAICKNIVVVFREVVFLGSRCGRRKCVDLWLRRPVSDDGGPAGRRPDLINLVDARLRGRGEDPPSRAVESEARRMDIVIYRDEAFFFGTYLFRYSPSGTHAR